MKNLIVILISVCLLGCNRKNQFLTESELSAPKYEIGRVYTQMPCDYNHESRFNEQIVGYSIELIEPIFEYRIDTIVHAEFDSKELKLFSYFRYEKLKVQEWSKYEAAYTLQNIANMTRAKISETEYEVKLIEKVIRKPDFKVNYYNKEPKNIPPNYYKSNCKIEFKEYFQPSIHHFKVPMLQHKLNELNYELEITDSMNDETINALKSYQQVNNLPIGQLDYETLHSLELDYETMVKKGVIKEQREVMRIEPTSNNK